MVTWTCADSSLDDPTWEQYLASFPMPSVYNSPGWGRYKAADGWSLRRCVATEAGHEAPRAVSQVLVKRYPLGTVVAWAPGGVEGELGCADRGFREALQAQLAARRLYIRLRSEHEHSVDESQALQQQGWRAPRQRLSSGKTIVLDLQGAEDELNQQLTKNWRHNLRRGQQRAGRIERWEAPVAAEMMPLFQFVKEQKWAECPYSETTLQQMLQHLHGRIIIYRAVASDGACIALRACAFYGPRAIDLLAATNEAGRRSYASYAVLWALLQHCRTQGIRHYDLSGVDPEHNVGVHNFKLGTGGRVLEYLGEWEYASSAPLRWLVNRRIARTAQ